MWHRLWRSVCRPAEAERGVVAEPPKLVMAAVAAGMIIGALVAPAPATSDGLASPIVEREPAVPSGVVEHAGRQD